MRSAKAFIILTTSYLFVYAIVINLGVPPLMTVLLGFFWPFIFIWMIYCILKDDQHKYPELGERQEWGYRDKNRDELGLF